MIARITRLAALVAAMLLAHGASSQALYTLTITSGPNPPSFSAGGTTFTFTGISPAGQTGSSASNFNVIDVGANSTTPPPATDSGSTTLSTTFTVSGTPGTESFTLTGPFTIVSGNTGGIVSTYGGSITNVTGSGYTVSFAGYAAPSPGSTPGTLNDGNISITIIPNAASTPEPASMAMMGLGLVGVGGFAAVRRRMRKTA